MNRALLVAIALLCTPIETWAQSDEISARSVLQIRCFPAGGETKATGFIWPEPGYMVTALHAVAGCENGIVLSEHAGLETTIERIVAVDLEPDLALVKLGHDLDLPALMIADDVPDIDAPHVVWGYPLAAEEMMMDQVRFSSGLSGTLTTLGRAYSSTDLLKLYRAQDFPTRDTQILRVASLLQHGQSGAPILDAQGRVIAIADGGLLGGWRGMNWSIPAHVYLPDLPSSKDEVPRVASQQALLMSSYAVREEKIVHLRETPPQNTFQPIGQIPLGDVILGLDAKVPGDFDWVFEELDGFIPKADWNEFMFDVLQDANSGAWIIVPAGTSVTTDPTGRIVQAASTEGAVVYADIYLEAESFDAARRDGLAQMDAYLAGLSGAHSLPDLLPETVVDHALEYANYDFYHEAPRDQAAFDVIIQINGPIFSGRVVHRDQHLDDMSDEAWMDHLMMNVAAFGLNSLEGLINPADWISMPAPRNSNDISESSALVLVRRVPLADVAADFVAAHDFGWKSDLVYLKSKLSDPLDFEALRFDVYEDRATGATVAVPEGVELEWNATLGAAQGIAGNGLIHLAIAVHQGDSFEDITGDNVLQFLEGLDGLAQWDDRKPTECNPTIDISAERASCWDYFAGTDHNTGTFADIYLGLTARENVFLGTSVYIVGEEDDLGDEDIIAYLMMRIGAEYLSDFAVH